MRTMTMCIATVCTLYASAAIPEGLSTLGMRDDNNSFTALSIPDSIAARILHANVALAHTDLFNPYRSTPCHLLAADARTLANGTTCVTLLLDTDSPHMPGRMFVATYDSRGRFADFIDCGDFYRNEIPQSAYAASVQTEMPVFMMEKGNGEIAAADIAGNSFSFANRLELKPMNHGDGEWHTAYDVVADFSVSDNGTISRKSLKVNPDRAEELCTTYIVWDHWLRSDRKPATLLPSELHQRGTELIGEPFSSPDGFKVTAQALTEKITDDIELYEFWDNDNGTDVRYPMALPYDLSMQAALYPDRFFSLLTNEISLPDEVKYKWLSAQEYTSIWLISDTHLRETIIASLRKHGDTPLPPPPAIPSID